MIQIDLLTKQKDSQTQKTNLWLPGRRESQGVWDGHVRTAIFKMNNQQGPTVQHMELCSVLCGSLGGREIWGRMDICIRMAESLQLFTRNDQNFVNWLYPIQNKFLKKNNKEINLVFISW